MEVFCFLIKEGTQFKKKKKKKRASLLAQMVKNLPAMWEPWAGALSQEDPLQKGIVIHSSIPVWEIPWTEEPGGLQSMRLQEPDTTK